MLRGPLHDRGPDGRCIECGEPFPCPTGIAIFEAVKRELENPPPPPELSSASPAAPLEEALCPQCLHPWVTHGCEDTEDGYFCMMIANSEAARLGPSGYARQLEEAGVPPDEARLRARDAMRLCGCTFAEGNPAPRRRMRS